MSYINATLSEITLNVKGLNVPTKEQRMADGFKKTTTLTQLYAVFKKHTLDLRTQKA